MLLAEDLGRRHEGADIAVFTAEPAQRRRDQRFAAADVALHKAVHHKAARHVRRSFLDRASLRAGGRERQSRIEGREVAPFKLQSALLRALCAQSAQRAGQDEELLEHQTAAGDGKRLKVGREVDVFKGIARLRQAVARADLLGQILRELTGAGVQALAHRVAERALVERGVYAVNGQDAAGDAAGLVFFFIGGVDHTAPSAAALDLSEKADAVAP